MVSAADRIARLEREAEQRKAERAAEAERKRTAIIRGALRRAAVAAKAPAEVVEKLASWARLRDGGAVYIEAHDGSEMTVADGIRWAVADLRAKLGVDRTTTPAEAKADDPRGRYADLSGRDLDRATEEELTGRRSWEPTLARLPQPVNKPLADMTPEELAQHAAWELTTMPRTGAGG